MHQYTDSQVNPDWVSLNYSGATNGRIGDRSITVAGREVALMLAEPLKAGSGWGTGSEGEREPRHPGTRAAGRAGQTGGPLFLGSP